MDVRRESSGEFSYYFTIDETDLLRAVFREKLYVHTQEGKLSDVAPYVFDIAKYKQGIPIKFSEPISGVTEELINFKNRSNTIVTQIAERALTPEQGSANILARLAMRNEAHNLFEDISTKLINLDTISSPGEIPGASQ